MTAKLFALVLSSLALTLAGCGGAGDAITISHAWAPATPPGATVGAAYMSIEAREADSLLSVSSPVAKSIELHRTSFEEGIAQMRKVDSVIVAPKAPLILESGGLHLMLMGMTAPLQAGQSIELTLSFQQAGEITTAVEVVAPNAEPAHH